MVFGLSLARYSNERQSNVFLLTQNFILNQLQRCLKHAIFALSLSLCSVKFVFFLSESFKEV